MFHAHARGTSYAIVRRRGVFDGLRRLTVPPRMPPAKPKVTVAIPSRRAVVASLGESKRAAAPPPAPAPAPAASIAGADAGAAPAAAAAAEAGHAAATASADHGAGAVEAKASGAPASGTPPEGGGRVADDAAAAPAPPPAAAATAAVAEAGAPSVEAAAHGPLSVPVDESDALPGGAGLAETTEASAGAGGAAAAAPFVPGERWLEAWRATMHLEVVERVIEVRLLAAVVVIATVAVVDVVVVGVVVRVPAAGPTHSRALSAQHLAPQLVGGLDDEDAAIARIRTTTMVRCHL